MFYTQNAISEVYKFIYQSISLPNLFVRKEKQGQEGREKREKTISTNCGWEQSRAQRVKNGGRVSHI